MEGGSGVSSSMHKKPSREELLDEWKKTKEMKHSSAPRKQQASTDTKSNNIYFTPYHPSTQSRVNPPLSIHSKSTSKLAKNLFQQQDVSGKENLGENYGSYNVFDDSNKKMMVRQRVAPSTPSFMTATSSSLSSSGEFVSREEQLRLWRERKLQKASQTPKSTTKPRPNPSSFSSTSSLFDPPRSFPRPQATRPALEVPRSRAQELAQQDDGGNETGNEGGDESEVVERRLSNEGIVQEPEAIDQSRSEEGVMDMSALIPSSDEALLQGLGQLQRTFEDLLHQIEERLRLIHEGGISAESARNWIKSLKPTYGKMTQYYVLWAIFEERLLLYENANQVYEEGILESAQPQYELLGEYRAFLDRKAQSDINRFNRTVEALSSSLAQSKILQSPPRTSPTLTQPPSRKSAHKLPFTPSRVSNPLPFNNTPSKFTTPSKPFPLPSRAPSTESLDTEAYPPHPMDPRTYKTEPESDAETGDSAKMDLNESLLDNFQHMEILTPRVYKSTPPRQDDLHYTPPHTPPSIPNEISDFSPVTPLSPANRPVDTPRKTPRQLMTPSRVINFEAILRDSVKKVLSQFDDQKESSYVVFEKVPLSKEESEVLGTEFAVTPVRKVGKRPLRSVNRNLLDEVEFTYTPKRNTTKAESEEEPESKETVAEVIYEGVVEESEATIKTEVKEEQTYHSDAELADDEHKKAKIKREKTPKTRKRSRSTLPLVQPSLGSFDSLEIVTKKKYDEHDDGVISIVATPHRSARKTKTAATPMNTPKRKKSRVEIEPSDDEADDDEIISVTNVRRSKRISSATPLKLPNQQKPIKVVFTPNYHRSSNVTEAAQLAQMIDMTHQDYYVSSD